MPFVDPRRQKAAEEYIATGNASHAARVAGVNRSTVMRWLKDADFQRLVSEASRVEGPAPAATKALTDLVHRAVEVVEQGLDGEATVGAGRLALDVIKVAAQLEPKGNPGESVKLADLLAELDGNKAK